MGKTLSSWAYSSVSCIGYYHFLPLFFNGIGVQKSVRPLLVELAKQRPDFAKQPALFLGSAPSFSWFYYGQEALVNQQLALEKQGLAKPLILPEYDNTPTLPAASATVFNQPVVAIVLNPNEPQILVAQKTRQDLTIRLLAKEGYYAAYLVTRK